MLNIFYQSNLTKTKCAKILADVWRIEYVWNILKEKLQECVMKYKYLFMLTNNR
jgi:hypothetical protein